MVNLFNKFNNIKNDEKKVVKRLTSSVKLADKKKFYQPISEKKFGTQHDNEKKSFFITNGGEKNLEKKVFIRKEELLEKRKKISPIQREVFCKGIESPLNIFLDILSSKTLQNLKLEYAAIKSYIFPEHTRNAFDHNMTLNKYKDIVCIDQTRVNLDPPGPYYYHGNFVYQLGMKHNFICCQGPMDDTIVDFWRLCIQKKVSIIICLVNIIENGKKKCSQYWPSNEGETIKFKHINVHYKSTDNCDDSFFIRNFKVWIDGIDNVTYRIRQIHWKDWPDKSVPPVTTPVMRLMRRLRDLRADETILAHCSAGIGRTGTLVAAVMLFSKISAKSDINVYDTVMDLRRQRAGAVQTEIQYIYLHKIIIDYCLIINVFSEARKSSAIKFIEKYNSYYESLLQAGSQPQNGNLLHNF
ncbi:Protein-tyrosine phosphatase, receptor/non-receptor type domain and Protein-tyrosine/Dual specificity phosphatase domain and Protein-tyrosine phosphatase, catalytic domain-containing protein [Strongyloides ratti]|uniref:Protein-tyrosine phosphatase, receptor/non-receptor type domain and Protein-tyrosine/Dual specificity phosphatase domain and Protein-tyrosine phosphatase, catalytic domain-containing protein n=1 Tax=Strongyloides ratti TaxID=34506 RepID=A0A090MZ29_STRRB|nr:Protein-tyrosine phosphatase, receptor/non-receptor type domain and Protein-tyrosine/Dual specificity phosphatase domain and Protein-tyrosine phosphatase, catalytic domain-containing protein [Strongyloides ratti]CEF68214.1 Protein-tyrosine phosphatase, receptor/non-receptor type domain and Protein-tyrosine/Dual specificity phosphatase domain and Protein-tyrosine phosphatase, catalytic domain-containing protein [Strongyloides ratti]